MVQYLNIGSDSIFTLTDQNSNNTVMATANHRLAFGNTGEYISGDGTDMCRSYPVEMLI